MTSEIQNHPPVFSAFGDDPDFGELVEMYIEEMPDRITTLETAFSSGDRELLQRTAHQMKGSGQSYGFDDMTTFAAAVEYSVRDGEPDECILKTLQELVGFCQRVRAGGAN